MEKTKKSAHNKNYNNENNKFEEELEKENINYKKQINDMKNEIERVSLQLFEKDSIIKEMDSVMSKMKSEKPNSFASFGNFSK